MLSFLNQLGIQENNAGACTGVHGWIKNTSASFSSINPTTGDVIANVYGASLSDYETVIQASQKAFSDWRRVPAPKRGELVYAIATALREKKDLLGSLVSLEMGKSKQEGDGEVQEMIDIADFAVGQSRMLYGKTTHSERPDHRMFEQWHPLGVTGVITAFNFPVAVWAWNAFIALICGNTIIWKPSPKTPLCAIAVQHICNEVMERFGYAHLMSLLISPTHEITTKMTEDKRLPLISFTGSSAVGRIVNASVANRLGRALLELSGNNAIILDDTADLNLAIPSIVFGAVGTAGQRCTTTRRLFVHHSIYEKVKSALVKAYGNITVGDPLDQKNLMGPLIDQAAVDGFLKTVNEAQSEGAKLLFGGKAMTRSGFFVEPTLIEAKNEFKTVQRETFGPILYLMSYNTLEEAIALQNESSFGLSSSLFTTNIHHSELFLSSRGSDCGIANINLGTSGAEIGGAFGGEKDTGGGREAGSDAWKAYMRRQTSTISWSKAITLAQGIKFEV